VAAFYQVADLMVRAAYRERLVLATVRKRHTDRRSLPARRGASETFWDGLAGVLDDTDDMDGFITAIDDYVRRPASVLAHK